MECLVCGSTDINTEFKSRSFDQYGLDKVILKNVQHITCEDCGYHTYTIPKHNLVLKQIRELLAYKCRVLDGREFAFLRNHLDYSGIELARYMGVSNVSISRWERGEQEVSALADRLIKAMTIDSIGRKGLNNLLKEMAEETDQSELVEVDLNNFANEKHYKYNTSLRFGENGHQAWIFSSTSDQKMCK